MEFGMDLHELPLSSCFLKVSVVTAILFTYMCKWNFVRILCIFILIWVRAVHEMATKIWVLWVLWKCAHWKPYFTSGRKWMMFHFLYLLCNLGEIQCKGSTHNAVENLWFLWKLVQWRPAFRIGLNEITLTPW
jgi:hypothetical protein